MPADYIGPCPHCRTSKVGFRYVGDHRLRDRRLWRVLYVCRMCTQGIVVTLQSSGSLTDSPGGTEDSLEELFHVLSVYPRSIAIAAPEHTPPTVAKVYVEGVAALRSGLYTAAGMSFRKVLERATLALSSGSKSFSDKALKQRIESLASQGIITDGLRDLAGQIRSLGNDAAHRDEEEFDGPSAKQIHEFTELFLIYTFTLPERVKLAQGSGEDEGDQ